MESHFYRRVILISLTLVYIVESKPFSEIRRRISHYNINGAEIWNSREFKLPWKLLERDVETGATKDKAMFEASSKNLFPSNENHNLGANWLDGSSPVPQKLIRRKRWFWSSNKDAEDKEKIESEGEEERDSYYKETTTTQQPKRSGWRSWFSNAATEAKKTYKKAKEKFKTRLKKVGKKIGRGFAKVRNYFTRSDDKFEVFVNKVKERVDQGDENALDLLNKLGIEVNYDNDGKPIGSAVNKTAKDVKEILESRGIYFSGNETVQEPAVKTEKNISSEAILPSITPPSSIFTSTTLICKTSPFSKTTPSAIPSETTTVHAIPTFLNGSEEANILTENLTTQHATSESQSSPTLIFSQPSSMETPSFSLATVSTSPVLEIHTTSSLPKTMTTTLPQNTPTPLALKPTLKPNIATNSTLQTTTLPPMISTSSLPEMSTIYSPPSTTQPKSTTSSPHSTVPPKTNTSSPPITNPSSLLMTATFSPTMKTTSSPPFRVPPLMLATLPSTNRSLITMTTTITSLPPTIATSSPTTTLLTTRPPTTTIITTVPPTTTTKSPALVTTHTHPITSLPTKTAETLPEAPTTITLEPISTTTNTSEPISTTKTTPELISISTNTPKPISTTTTTVELISTTMATVEPISTTTTTVEPISTTTTTPEPLSTTTPIPTTTESTEPPPFPDIFGDSLVRDRLHEVFLHGDFNHDELRNTFEFDPALYDDYYHYEY